MTRAEIITQQRERMRRLLDERATYQQTIDQVRQAVGDGDPTSEQSEQLRAARAERERVDGDIDEARERVRELEDEQRREDDAATLRRELGQTDQRETPRAPATVTTEERTYSADASRRGRSVFVDMYRAQRLGDYQAAERLQRHMQEARVDGEMTERAGDTGDYGGLVAPQYLVDMFAPINRAGRPVANLCTPHQLPTEGMTLNIPKGDSGLEVDPQNGENTALTGTDYAASDIAVPVRTVGGWTDTSRQSLERGTPGIDELLYADIVSAYHTELDRQVLVGTGANGEHKGILNATGVISVTYTDADPTIAELWRKLADATSQIEESRFANADIVVFASRRWGWMTAETDADGRPTVVVRAVGPQNGMAINNAAQYGGVRGELANGLVAVTDGNVPKNLGTGTNEDRVFVLRTPDLHLWEDGGQAAAPRQLRFEEPGGKNLTVTLLAYGYSAFTAERYGNSHAVVSGTGLVTPVF